MAQDKEKYRQMARFTLACFSEGAIDEVEETSLVPICSFYPMVRIREASKQELDCILQEKNKEGAFIKDGSFIFRKVIAALVPDLNDLAVIKGVKGFMRKHSVKFFAALA